MQSTRKVGIINLEKYGLNVVVDQKPCRDNAPSPDELSSDLFG